MSAARLRRPSESSWFRLDLATTPPRLSCPTRRPDRLGLGGTLGRAPRRRRARTPRLGDSARVGSSQQRLVGRPASSRSSSADVGSLGAPALGQVPSRRVERRLGGAASRSARAAAGRPAGCARGGRGPRRSAPAGAGSSAPPAGGVRGRRSPPPSGRRRPPRRCRTRSAPPAPARARRRRGGGRASRVRWA